MSQDERQWTVVVDAVERVDVGETWPTCLAFLDAPVDPTDEAMVDRHIAEVARVAWSALLLAIKAKRYLEATEREVEHALGTLRAAALEHLNGEVQAKRLGGNRVTNDLIDYTASEGSPDEWQRLHDRIARAKTTREAMEGLHDKLMEKSRRLGDLKGPSGAERTNRGASRRTHGG